MTVQTRRGLFLHWLRHFGIWVLIYLACYGAMIWAQRASLAAWLRVVLTIAPIIPGLGLLWVTLRSYQRSDEFIRLGILKAAATAALFTASWTLVYSYLQPLGLPNLPVGLVHAFGWPIFVGLMIRLIRIEG